jgi:hypothetical protein
MTVAMGPDRKAKSKQHSFVGAASATSKHRRSDDVGVLKETVAGFGVESQCIEDINRFGHD